MQFVTGTMVEFGNRGETPSLLIQFQPAIAIGGSAARIDSHTVTWNYLMGESDLALNMLREHLRRSWR